MRKVISSEGRVCFINNWGNFAEARSREQKEEERRKGRKNDSSDWANIHENERTITFMNCSWSHHLDDEIEISHEIRKWEPESRKRKKFMKQNKYNLPGRTQLHPHWPSQRHRFLVLIQSSSTEHFRRHCLPRAAASSRFLGQNMSASVSKEDDSVSPSVCTWYQNAVWIPIEIKYQKVVWIPIEIKWDWKGEIRKLTFTCWRRSSFDVLNWWQREENKNYISLPYHGQLKRWEWKMEVMNGDESHEMKVQQ